ncbi:MAG: KH domain-containing protein [Deltaproteobacteria bacterium]|nr:KH domain-containing protein [Deltaproteobacteria bacterium]
MSNEYQEFRGKNLNEILERIGNLWNCTLNGIDYELVREGSRGVMGLGARDVVIRARRIEPLDDDASQEERASGAPTPSEPKDFSPQPDGNTRRQDRGRGRGRERGNERGNDWGNERPPRRDAQNIRNDRPPRDERDEERPQQPERKYVRPEVTPLPAEALEKAKQVAERLARYLAPETTIEIRPGNVLELISENGALLIGRHGQTLDAIQYLVNKISSRGVELPADTYIIVDTEGYRERREQALFRLAIRLAQKARQSGRLQSVEPMPAHERRIIHVTLQDEPEVRTESLGDGDLKRVVVVPARRAGGSDRGPGPQGPGRNRGNRRRRGRGRGPRPSGGSPSGE